MVHLLSLLTQPIEIEGKTIPGWYMSYEHQFIERNQLDYPRGNFNLGLSHGIPGVVAFLSIALLHGIKIQGQIEAIERAVAWIQKKKKEGKCIILLGGSNLFGRGAI